MGAEGNVLGVFCFQDGFLQCACARACVCVCVCGGGGGGGGRPGRPNKVYGVI